LDDDESGEIDPEEFIDALYRIRCGNERTGTAFVKHYVNRIKSNQDSFIAEMKPVIDFATSGSVTSLRPGLRLEEPFATGVCEQYDHHVLADGHHVQDVQVGGVETYTYPLADAHRAETAESKTEDGEESPAFGGQIPVEQKLVDKYERRNCAGTPMKTATLRGLLLNKDLFPDDKEGVQEEIPKSKVDLTKSDH